MSEPDPTTPYADPPEPDGVPWALQVVVRVEKDPAPEHLAVLRSVASAVALALDGFLAEDAEAEVRRRTERWRAGPIRKVVRRARGAGWTRQLAVPGVHVHQGEIDVAVHVPGPVDDVHPEVARLQVGGLNLDNQAGPASPADFSAGSSARLVVNPHVEMTTGKAAAQVGHGAQLVLQDLAPEAAAAWLAAGAPVTVDPRPAEGWDDLVARAPVVVADGGFTEVAPGTVTVVAFPPGS